MIQRNLMRHLLSRPEYGDAEPSCTAPRNIAVKIHQGDGAGLAEGL